MAVNPERCPHSESILVPEVDAVYLAWSLSVPHSAFLAAGIGGIT